MQGFIYAADRFSFVIELFGPNFLLGEGTGTTECFKVQRSSKEKDIKD